MLDLTIDQMMQLTFDVCPTPILAPFGGAVVVADPSLLTPDQSPDAQWHMFFHTTFGVYHFRSADGTRFERVQKVARDAMRPNINRIGDRYYLFYEKTRTLLANALNLFNWAKWRSAIYVRTSTNLVHWSKGRPVIDQANGYENSDRGSAISNPFLLPLENGYRLYFSCGLTYIRDCHFCEPTYIHYAEGPSPDADYVVGDAPIIRPDPAVPYLNLCSGCLKVYRLRDGYIGIQNGIYMEDGASHSAIFLLTSADGLQFTFAKALVRPQFDDPTSWMHQFVYASHLVRCGNVLRLYFNARDTSDMVRGRECIGYAEAAIPQK